jgi:hypothetical protein
MTLRADIKPLDADEKRWLKRLESVLRDMPERLYLIECGDALMLVDREAARHVDLYDGLARTNGVVLADVQHGSFKVTGVGG